MDKFERQLKMKQIIRNRFQENHENRIRQLEAILINQGISYNDIASWLYKRKNEARMELLESESFSQYNIMQDLKSISLKLEKIESEFYRVIINPKKGKKVLLNSVAKLPKNIKHSQFIPITSAILVCVILLGFYSFFMFMINNTTGEVELTRFQTSFLGIALIPLVTGLVYFANNGKVLYSVIPVIIWLKFLTPYVLDLNSELVCSGQVKLDNR